MRLQQAAVYQPIGDRFSSDMEMDINPFIVGPVGAESMRPMQE